MSEGVNSPDEMLGWHSLSADGLTSNGEGVKVEVGQTLVFDGDPILCKQGYHASERAIDMLEYITGPIICRVRLHGTIVRDSNKAVATHRTCIAMFDATILLREFAIWCAEESLKIIDADKIDPRSLEAIRVAKLYCKGEATDKELAAAWAAARDAAWAAAWAAARDAAWDAAWAAAWAAARAAAWAAAWDAARDAARAAARAAAWDAAWAAARAAARDAQNKKLEEMLLEAMALKV